MYLSKSSENVIITTSLKNWVSFYYLKFEPIDQELYFL